VLTEHRLPRTATAAGLPLSLTGMAAMLPAPEAAHLRLICQGDNPPIAHVLALPLG
jgi:hypothetical protein